MNHLNDDRVPAPLPRPASPRPENVGQSDDTNHNRKPARKAPKKGGGEENGTQGDSHHVRD